MTIFLSGGCKNGKSSLAQTAAKTLAGDGPLYYVATMIPHDEEDRARIRRHLAEREGWGFRTLELGHEVSACLEETGGRGSYLLDSVTALLANEMFLPDGSFEPNAPAIVAEDLTHFAREAEHVVFVSDYLYCDAGRYDEWTEAYRRGLAYVDRALARCCDTVAEIASGTRTLFKGALPV
jgi:adenosylcobinamide kinase/adenosylcobinamide-phosphate guanylyltransferase